MSDTPKPLDRRASNLTAALSAEIGCERAVLSLPPAAKINHLLLFELQEELLICILPEPFHSTRRL